MRSAKNEYSSEFHQPATGLVPKRPGDEATRDVRRLLDAAVTLLIVASLQLWISTQKVGGHVKGSPDTQGY